EADAPTEEGGSGEVDRPQEGGGQPDNGLAVPGPAGHDQGGIQRVEVREGQLAVGHEDVEIQDMRRPTPHVLDTVLDEVEQTVPAEEQRRLVDPEGDGTEQGEGEDVDRDGPRAFAHRHTDAARPNVRLDGCAVNTIQSVGRRGNWCGAGDRSHEDLRPPRWRA